MDHLLPAKSKQLINQLFYFANNNNSQHAVIAVSTIIPCGLQQQLVYNVRKMQHAQYK